jgi:transketolase
VDDESAGHTLVSMPASRIEAMRRNARELRLTVVEMIHRAGSGHLGGSLSAAEMLTVLYDAVMRTRPEEPAWPDRDRLVLSKGHAAPALYATLARKGYFDPRWLETLRRIDSPLQGHPSMRDTPGVEISTGSLGMGVSVGVGMALAARATGRDFRVFVLCGDGELQEGQNWEAFMAAAKWRLGNLRVIIDRNHVQLDGPVADIMPIGDVEAKLKAFGWHACRCDGHDVRSLLAAFDAALAADGPAAIVAKTVKGKGVSFMEGQAAWHGKPIGDAEYAQAVKELRQAVG